MAGTKAGGIKAAATNKAKYGEDFYRELGRKGGRNGHTGGFAANPELAKIAGAIGGRKSKRGKAKKNTSGGRTNRESHLEREQERTIEQDGKIYGRAFWK